MLVIFAFSILFWMFFEQAGDSFNFLAERSSTRDIGMQGLFGAGRLQRSSRCPGSQSVNSVAIIVLAPIPGYGWVKMGRNNPIIRASSASA